MEIVSTTLRAIVERVTELRWPHKGENLRLYVFDHLGKDGNSAERWIQNWYCDDVTVNFTPAERKEIYDVVDKHYKCNANK